MILLEKFSRILQYSRAKFKGDVLIKRRFFIELLENSRKLKRILEALFPQKSGNTKYNDFLKLLENSRTHILQILENSRTQILSQNGKS